MRRKWTIKAHPQDSDPLSVEFAKTLNENPDRFWTRSGAARTKRFYDSLHFPVLLLVMRDDE